jgi:hypothetical protein
MTTVCAMAHIEGNLVATALTGASLKFSSAPRETACRDTCNVRARLANIFNSSGLAINREFRMSGRANISVAQLRRSCKMESERISSNAPI